MSTPDELTEAEVDWLTWEFQHGNAYVAINRILADRRAHYAAALEGAREDVTAWFANNLTHDAFMHKGDDELADGLVDFLAARLGVHGPMDQP